MSAVQATPTEIEKRTSRSSVSSVEKQQEPHVAEKDITNLEAGGEHTDDKEEHSWFTYRRFRPYILAGSILVILGWWISSTILPATRHRWYVLSHPSMFGADDSPGFPRRFGLGFSFCE